MENCIIHDERIRQLESMVAQQKVLMERVEAGIEKLDVRFQDLNYKLSELKSEVSGQNNTIEELVKKVDKIEQQLPNKQERKAEREQDRRDEFSPMKHWRTILVWVGIGAILGKDFLPLILKLLGG